MQSGLNLGLSDGFPVVGPGSWVWGGKTPEAECSSVTAHPGNTLPATFSPVTWTSATADVVFSGLPSCTRLFNIAACRYSVLFRCAVRRPCSFSERWTFRWFPSFLFYKHNSGEYSSSVFPSYGRGGSREASDWVSAFGHLNFGVDVTLQKWL